MSDPTTSDADFDAPGELRQLSARIARMQSQLRTAETAAKAVDWFEQYGHMAKIDPANNMRFRCDLHYAGSCPGAKEAAEYLERIIQEQIGNVIADALKLARHELMVPFRGEGEKGEAP